MIEVNLLPGGKKGGSGGLSFSLPDFREMFKRGSGGGGGGGAGSRDPYMVFFAFAASVALGYFGFSFVTLSSEASGLATDLERELADSVALSETIERINRLQAQGDSIARRVAIIQEIDAGRYVWPHLLDEVAAAVPDYTWLREVLYSGQEPQLQVRVVGRAGSIFAITNYMRRLEASRFLRNVLPENIQEVASEENPDDRVHEFEFLLTYEPPPIEELTTVPLFGEASAQNALGARGN